MSASIAEPAVGIMPAAGHAQRSVQLPCSKEIVPVGLNPPGPRGAARAKPACEDLLEGFRAAGAERGIVVVRTGKLDIPGFLGDGAQYGLSLAYVPLADSPGVPWTAHAALPHALSARVLFGFPDILIRPQDGLAQLVAQQRRSGADVTLGLFPAQRPDLVDMVAVGDDGRVRDIVIKPATSSLHLTWLLACWSPAFSDFLARWVNGGGASVDDDRERHMGDVVRAAVLAGHHVDSVTFQHGTYLDIGTPAGLTAALRAIE